MSSARRDEVMVPSYKHPKYHFVYEHGNGWVPKADAATDGGRDA